MKKALPSSIALGLALTTSAFAADLPNIKAPIFVPAPPEFTWTGFYVGINGGFGGGLATSQLSTLYVSPFGFVTSSTTNAQAAFGDFFVGGQGGFNYQFANRIVVGVETDMQWSGIAERANANTTSTTAFAGFVGATTGWGGAKFGQDWFGTSRVRIGYAVTDRFLPYITGGVAYSSLNGGINWTTATSGIGITSLMTGATSDTKVGWTVGAGVEYAITNNLTFKTEYLYQEYAGLSVPVLNVFPGFFGGPASAAFGTLQTGNFGVHVVRAGFNWKFGAAPAPIFAKY